MRKRFSSLLGHLSSELARPTWTTLESRLYNGLLLVHQDTRSFELVVGGLLVYVIV